MRLLYLLFFFTGLLQPIMAQYTYIPDTVFEQSLVDQNIDSDNMVNGQVLTADVATLTELTVGGGGLIISMEGIQSFTALEDLKVTYNPGLTVLDLSNNVNLKIVECYNNSLEYLNIDNCTLLETLWCGNNYLTQLNVSNSINLKLLWCENNQLNQLDVSNNILLEQLICRNNNNLFSLDITNNINLYYLESLGININTLDVSQNINLLYLHIGYNNLTTLDVSNNVLLKVLNCDNNQLTSLDVSNNINLYGLACNNNSITSLNLNNNSFIDYLPDLEYSFLLCNDNNLTELYIQNGNNELLNGTFPFTGENRFNSTNNPNLTCIYVDDVANCTANWLGVDATSHFVSTTEECNSLTTKAFDYSNLNIYPNPAKNYIIIDIKNDSISNICVYDVLGKKVLETNNNQNKIDVSSLKKGMYFAKLKTANDIIFIEKIIKE